MKEHRTEPREKVDLPIKVDGRVGDKVRNLSVYGLYFETSIRQSVGDFISVEIELDTPDGPKLLKAEGQIKRIESHGDRTGVGVKLFARQLKAIYPDPDLPPEGNS